MHTTLMAGEYDARLDSIVSVCWTVGCWHTTATAGIVAPRTGSSLLCIAAPTDDVVALVFETQYYLGCRRIGCQVPPRLNHAWKAFHREWEPLIRHMAAVACRRALPAVDYDDLVQDVWHEIVKKLPGLCYWPDLGGLSGWLATVIRRKAVKVARRHLQYIARHQCLSESEAESLPCPHLGPEDLYRVTEMRCEVDLAFGRLKARTSERNYEIFRRRFLWGQTAQEIGAAVGLTAQEVRYRYHRVKRRWRKLTKGQPFCDEGGEAEQGVLDTSFPTE